MTGFYHKRQKKKRVRVGMRTKNKPWHLRTDEASTSFTLSIHMNIGCRRTPAKQGGHVANSCKPAGFSNSLPGLGGILPHQRIPLVSPQHVWESVGPFSEDRER